MDGGGIFDLELFGGMGLGLDVPYQQAGKSFVGQPGTGAHCSDPKALQQMLNDLGFPVGPVDGQVGNNTLKAQKNFAAGVGLPDPLFGAKGAFCEALMAAWQAAMGQAPPAPPSAASTSKITGKWMQAAPMVAKHVAPGSQFAMSASKKTAAPKSGAASSVSLLSDPKAWWNSQSTGMKIGVGVGAVVVVGAVGYVALGEKKSATPNRRRRRRRAR